MPAKEVVAATEVAATEVEEEDTTINMTKMLTTLNALRRLMNLRRVLHKQLKVTAEVDIGATEVDAVDVEDVVATVEETGHRALILSGETKTVKVLKRRQKEEMVRTDLLESTINLMKDMKVERDLLDQENSSILTLLLKRLT